VVTGVRSIDAMFGLESRIEGILTFEAALARASAREDVIPAAAADVIASQCNLSRFDLASIEREAEAAGNEAIPTIDQLRARVAAVDESAANWVHWGATSQDAIDTALVLHLRDALGSIDAVLARLIGSLAGLAELHAATPMIGRTLLQDAAPTTFGFKVACWLDALLRHRARLALARNEASVVQFGGAVGNLSAFGADARRVATALAAELQLEAPDVAWHTSRDRLATVATNLAATVATLGKVARDIALLAQSEIAEVREPAGAGRGRSSTMPQKRNPISCGAILAAAVRAPGLAATMLSSMAQEHERGLGGWQAEWTVLPELALLTHEAIVTAAFVMDGLEVDADRMARNIAATNGLIFAEGVSFALRARVGRVRAGEILGRALGRVDAETTLRAALESDSSASSLLSPDEIDSLFSVGRHLGVAEETARRVAAAARENIASVVTPR